MKTARLAGLVGLFWSAYVSAGDAGSLAANCQQLFRLSDFDTAVQPGLLVEAADSIPAHCSVKGVIDRSIRFQMSLPLAGWQGRFMFHAPGGLAGVLGDTTSLLADGFAMATTDTGHEGANDSGFVQDDKAFLNFAFRANHLTTRVAKKIIAAFYGRQADYNYLWGCSNGGRAALIEALRYPEDYDGIIAGAPALGWGEEMLPWGLAAARRQAEHPLTLESLELLDAASASACDQLDGVADGVIGNPPQCTVEKLNLEGLRCERGQSSGCLTAGQIETARFMYTGVEDESGQVLSPGVYPGAEAAGDWRLWMLGEPSFLPQTANELMGGVIADVLHDQPGFQLDQFDLVADRQALFRATIAMDVPAPDFSAFRGRGGKLIIYNGWQDVPCRAAAMTDYWAKAERMNGGVDDLAEFSRLYMVPGMLHCTGGPGAWATDYVQALVDWVEADAAPGALVGQHPGIVDWFEAMAATASATVNWHDAVLQAGAAKGFTNGISRPICPYPQYAKYNGTGNPDNADSFACVQD